MIYQKLKKKWKELADRKLPITRHETSKEEFLKNSKMMS